jgi:hypothetical protein
MDENDVAESDTHGQESRDDVGAGDDGLGTGRLRTYWKFLCLTRKCQSKKQVQGVPLKMVL